MICHSDALPAGVDPPAPPCSYSRNEAVSREAIRSSKGSLGCGQLNLPVLAPWDNFRMRVSHPLPPNTTVLVATWSRTGFRHPRAGPFWPGCASLGRAKRSRVTNGGRQAPKGGLMVDLPGIPYSPGLGGQTSPFEAATRWHRSLGARGPARSRCEATSRGGGRPGRI